jgi:trans-2,3-dihydro-3-hydroxyanthranilate isomerase
VDLAFHTVDVFTATRFGGNPLAVVHDADALSDAQMLAITREFNYSETTFLCRPTDAAHTARVRIFTPGGEVPFAGHPNIGTAFVLAHLPAHRTATRFLFEEAAGLVPLTIQRDGDSVTATRLTAPRPLTTGPDCDTATVAACLDLAPADIATTRHPPRSASVGLPFLVAEIATRAALSRARGVAQAFAALPPDAPRMIFLYTRDLAPADGAVDLTARMFAPFDGVPEDPATGSATAAACGMLAALTGQPSFRVAQGIDMGRPSLLTVDVDATGIHLGGSSVPVMAGTLTV